MKILEVAATIEQDDGTVVNNMLMPFEALVNHVFEFQGQSMGWSEEKRASFKEIIKEYPVGEY